MKKYIIISITSLVFAQDTQPTVYPMETKRSREGPSDSPPQKLINLVCVSPVIGEN